MELMDHLFQFKFGLFHLIAAAVLLLFQFLSESLLVLRKSLVVQLAVLQLLKHTDYVLHTYKTSTELTHKS